MNKKQLLEILNAKGVRPSKSFTPMRSLVHKPTKAFRSKKSYDRKDKSWKKDV